MACEWTSGQRRERQFTVNKASIFNILSFGVVMFK
jgi:hypothetical protein